MALVQKNTHQDILLHAASGGELDPHVIKKIGGSSATQGLSDPLFA
jgi:hypothetical protein